MTGKQLKKLKRNELLEILVIQSEKIDAQKEEMETLRELAESKDINIQNAGSIAEASIKLNSVFENAQNAADQYLENIHRIEEERQDVLKEAQEEAELIIKKAQEKADEIISKAQERVDNEVKEAIDRALIERDLVQTDKTEENIKKKHGLFRR